MFTWLRSPRGARYARALFFIFFRVGLGLPARRALYVDRSRTLQHHPGPSPCWVYDGTYFLICVHCRCNVDGFCTFSVLIIRCDRGTEHDEFSSPGALMTFMLMGPMLDVKNVFMLSAVFSTRFTLRICATITAVVTLAGLVLTWWGLGGAL